MEQLNINDRDGYPVRSATLRDLLAIAFRHRRLMVLSFLGILSGAMVAAILQSNRFQAEMKILVKRERVDPVVSTEPSALPQFTVAVSEEELNSEVELLKSRDLLAKVVLACGLQHPKSDSAWSRMRAAIRVHTGTQTSQGDARIASAVRKLGSDLRVEVIKKTNLIAVNYESPDPELAARVLTALSNLYLEKHVTIHRPPGAFDFFHQEAQQYRKGLAEAEARLIGVTRGAAVVWAQLEKQVALQKLAEFDGTVRQSQAAVAETQQRIRVLQEQARSTPTRMVTQVRTGDDGALLSQLRSNLLTLELKRTEVLGKFEPGYRLVQEVQSQIAQTRAAIALAEKSQLHEETTDRDPSYELIREELAKAKADLAGLQARAEATALTVRSYRENARSLEQKELVQDDLIRTAKVTEENYLLYLRKEEEARMSDVLDRRRIINVSIAEPATVPSLPSNGRQFTALMGTLLATCVSVGLAFGAEYLDPTFRTPDELTSFLNIPVLAAMPQGKKNGKANGKTTYVS